MRLGFQHSEIGTFFQALPRLQNPYTSDAFLCRFLKRLLPVDIHQAVEKDFTSFGNRIIHELEPLSNECEAHPPYLVNFNAWGKRVDDVVTCDAWKRMKAVSAEEGFIALPYEGKYGKWSRLVQFAKLYLYSPSSGLYSCPLAMTDGAAKTIKELKLTNLQFAYDRLTSRSPKDFWTSGQWMTERRGGSDVASGTETIATLNSNTPDKYVLHGYKWFTSATDADMALTLARIRNSNGETTEGSPGLSMFFVKTRRDNESLNNIHVMRLKNKLGTRQLPTGELLLDGTEAVLASEAGRGVAAISNVLTITRIHNAAASVSAMRRILSLSRDYSKKRDCFGHKICDFPIHVDTLASLELETRGGVALFLEVARLLGFVEGGGTLGDEENLLRLLTPVVKLYTGKGCIGVISEGLESFGGQGYQEDTGLPRILRDAQVTPIWEGTTNILSLDVLRAILKSKGQVLVSLQRNLNFRLSSVLDTIPETHPQVQKLMQLLGEILEATKDAALVERGARAFAFAIAHVTIGTLLLEQAAGPEATRTDRTAAIRWTQNLISLRQRLEMLKSEGGSSEDSSELVFDGYEE